MTAAEARMFDTLVFVAIDRAAREGRPIVVLQGPAAWTCQPADAPPRPDYRVVCTVHPDGTVVPP